MRWDAGRFAPAPWLAVLPARPVERHAPAAHHAEAYLLVGNLPKAEEHLAALQKICLIPCAEHADLKKPIDEFRRRAAGR